MSLRTIMSIILGAGFLFFAAYIIFYPPYYSKKQSVNGEVVIVWKPAHPRSSWLIELREHDKIRVVSYPFLNDVITINEGDSLRKSKNSDEVSLRLKNTDNWILLDETILFKD